MIIIYDPAKGEKKPKTCNECGIMNHAYCPCIHVPILYEVQYDKLHPQCPIIELKKKMSASDKEEFRMNIAEQLSRMELIERICELNEERFRVRQEWLKLYFSGKRKVKS